MPTGLAFTSVTATYRSKTGPKPWPATWLYAYNSSTRTIEFSKLAVAPGGSIAVTVTVDSCFAGSYNWATDLRQSNNFLGTRNKFNRVGLDPVTTITQPCRLEFTGQPTNSYPGGTITTVEYVNDAAPVAVSALDGAGTPITGWTGNITLGVSGGNAGATLTGGGAVAPVGGTATYTPSLDLVSDTPYQLTASSPGLTSATSADFTILFKAVVQCDGSVCSTPTVPGPGGGSAQATTDDGVDGTLELEWDPDGGEVPNCPNYQGMNNTVFFNLTNSSNSLVGLTKTIQLVIPNDPSKSSLADYQVCFRAPYAFSGWNADTASLFELMTSEFPAATPADEVQPGRWQGLLFNCTLPGASAPCILSRATVSGGVSIVLRVPAGDPWAR